MVESMVERVARAIDPRAFDQFESLRDYCLRNGDDEAEALRTAEWAHGHDVRQAIEKARAAIEAMREPTEEMLDVGACYEDQDHHIFDEGHIARDVWTNMIDAALALEAKP